MVEVPHVTEGFKCECSHEFALDFIDEKLPPENYPTALKFLHVDRMIGINNGDGKLECDCGRVYKIRKHSEDETGALVYTFARDTNNKLQRKTI